MNLPTGQRFLAVDALPKEIFHDLPADQVRRLAGAPLTKWFLGMHLMTASKNNESIRTTARGWPDWIGTGGRIASESVAGLDTQPQLGTDVL
jgi:hypothetical protein